MTRISVQKLYYPCAQCSYVHSTVYTVHNLCYNMLLDIADLFSHFIGLIEILN